VELAFEEYFSAWVGGGQNGFQSLFLWNSPSKFVSFGLYLVGHVVSILVFVELAFEVKTILTALL